VDLHFVPRGELKDKEWDEEKKQWDRPKVDHDTLQRLNARSTLEGSVRVVVHLGLIAGTGWLAVFAGLQHILLAVASFLVYCWLVGFLHGIEHEMRHRIVFSRRLDWLSDVIYFLIHVLWKVGSRNQRVSHVIHHRYTMVRGVDPEPAFPEDLTTRWLRRHLLAMLVTVVTLGIPDFFKTLWALIQRARGRLDPMIKAQCSDKDLRFIRRESVVILVANVAAVAAFVVLGRWDLIVLTMLGPQIGHGIAAFYHRTEHIAMMYNTTDQRLCTRGVKVSPVTKFFYGGLDEHVEHHLFPGVPSRNLTRLRRALDIPIPERRNVIVCWKEIFAIARHQETQRDEVFVPAGYP
jgi:fatty acid desaturase